MSSTQLTCPYARNMTNAHLLSLPPGHPAMPSSTSHNLPASLLAKCPVMSSSAASSAASLSSSASSSTDESDASNPLSLTCPTSSSTASLSVSTVPGLLHPFFSSSDLLSHSASLLTVSDLLALSTLNKCIAALAKSEKIWRPRLNAAISLRYPVAAQLALDDETIMQAPLSHHDKQHPYQRQQQESTVALTCPWLSAIHQGRSDKRPTLAARPLLFSPNPFVSDLMQQVEASMAKEEKKEKAEAATNDSTTDDASGKEEAAPTGTPTVTVLSSMSVPLFYSPFSLASELSSKARYIALSQCSLHNIVNCSRLVAPLPPLPAPDRQAYWAHTRVLNYPAPPSVDSCDPLPTMPLCAGCRASLAVCMKDYYDYRGEWAGQFTMMPLSIVIVRPPDVSATAASDERPVVVLDVRYSHIGGYDGTDLRRFEMEYIKAADSGCTCGCGGVSAGASSVGEWSVRVMHRYRSGIYAMDGPLNVVHNDRLNYSHLRERERHAQRKRKTVAAPQPALATA